MIRTYELSHESKTPLYVQLYEAIRADILSGSLPGGEKLPSKRALAEHLSLSKITVETAYAQLLDEGYLTSRERSGYFVAHMPLLAKAPARYEPETAKAPEPEPQQNAAAELFPFSVWAKLMRSVILDEGQYLLQPVPNGGLLPLRRAIAGELARQRGLVVQPEQIVIGAGTEYFYALLAQFLGRGQRFAIEDPCHRTLAQVYSRSGAEVVPVPMDESGIRVAELEASGAQIVHVSPSHQYPTGTVMPIPRRQELLAWMGRGEERFLIEDDYDSEFRFDAHPVPAMQSLDDGGRVIYMNSFSKSLAPGIRIACMVLPQSLLARYRRDFATYANTVSRFEQQTLARFIREGYFTRHLARERVAYKARRDALAASLRAAFAPDELTLTGLHTGLHLLARLKNAPPDAALHAAAKAQGVALSLLSDYDLTGGEQDFSGTFVLGYGSLSEASFPEAGETLRKVCTAAWEASVTV